MAERADIDRAPHGRKSSKSGTQDNCLYWDFRDGLVYVRNSKRPELGEIPFTRDEWTAFLGGAKEGEADWPAP